MGLVYLLIKITGHYPNESVLSIIAQRLAEVQEQMPAQVPGPKAIALAAISSDLAAMGDIKSAIDAKRHPKLSA
jgi:hypothetical protein